MTQNSALIVQNLLDIWCSTFGTHLSFLPPRMTKISARPFGTHLFSYLSDWSNTLLDSGTHLYFLPHLNFCPEILKLFSCLSFTILYVCVQITDEKMDPVKPTFDQISQVIEPIFACTGVVAGLLLDQGLTDLTVIQNMTKEELLISIICDLSHTVASLKENLIELAPPQTPQRFTPTTVKLSSPESDDPPPDSLDKFKTACECASNLNLFNKEAKKLRLLLKKMTAEKLSTLTEAQKFFIHLSELLIEQSAKNLTALYDLAEELQSDWSFRLSQALMSPDYWPSFSPTGSFRISCYPTQAFSTLALV
jgi:hypothetical protein